MATQKKLHIVLDAASKTMQVTQDINGVNNVEVIPREHILGVHPIGYYAGPTDPVDKKAYWDQFYPYPTMTVVCVRLRGSEREELRIELQDVSNQPGWSTGTQAGINQCVADFVTFLT